MILEPYSKDHDLQEAVTRLEKIFKEVNEDYNAVFQLQDEAIFYHPKDVCQIEETEGVVRILYVKCILRCCNARAKECKLKNPKLR